MITFYSHIANMRCPTCDQLQSVFQVFRTNEARPSIWGPLPFLECNMCARKLRIANYNKTLHFLLVVPVFLGSAAFGMFVFSYLGLFERAGSEGPNFVGFVLVFALFVVPAVLLCARLLKVEVLS